MNKSKASAMLKASGIIGIVLCCIQVVVVAIVLVFINSIPTDNWNIVDGLELKQDEILATVKLAKTVFTVVFVVALAISLIPSLIASIKLLRYSSLSDYELQNRSVLAWSIVLLIFGCLIAGIFGIVAYSQIDNTPTNPYVSNPYA
ncbi:MAG: hypothetical protein LBK70_02675 [Clostridiales bacterium]|jgi:hypothetical protein|nr:hypothetical protein [Clostridiales bacterium]